MKIVRTIILAAMPVLLAQVAFADSLPVKVGQCSMTSVKDVTTRLEGMADSGSAIDYANGGYQVSYDQIPGIERSKAGDSIKLCLIALPTNCPPGDDRGRQYRATNMRTHASWEAADAEHMCGGA